MSPSTTRVNIYTTIAIINDFEDESIMLEDNPDKRSMVTKFILDQTFYDWGYFRDALKKFVIVKKFWAWIYWNK